MVTRLARYFVEAREQGWSGSASSSTCGSSSGGPCSRGRVDRLERDPAGALRVVDLKTGSRASRPPDEVGRTASSAPTRPAVERGAFAEHGSRSAGAALLQVGKAAGATTTLQVQPPLTGDEDPRLGRRARSPARPRAWPAREFLATVGPACQLCAVRSSCPGPARGAGDLMPMRYSADQIATALGQPDADASSRSRDRGPAAPAARRRRCRVGQDRDDGRPGGLAGRQRARRARPGARPDLHPQGRDRAGRAHRDGGCAGCGTSGCGRRPSSEDGAEVLGGTPTVSTYHSYAGRLVREHVLRLGIEPESRLLSEAAALAVRRGGGRPLRRADGRRRLRRLDRHRRGASTWPARWPSTCSAGRPRALRRRVRGPRARPAQGRQPRPATCPRGSRTP